MTITLLDGGMGQELMARSSAAATPLWSATTMQDEPDLVVDVHLDYFRSGAEIATTNSYILHRDRLQQNDAEEQFESLNILACELAARARDDHGAGIVAGGLGPTGRSYRPDLALEIEQGAEVYAELARLHAPFVDFHLLETMASLKQAEGAVMGAKTTGKPVWLSVTVDDQDGSVLRSGESLASLLPIIDRHSVDAVLINCSVPEAVNTSVGILAEGKPPFGAYANGFTKISDTFKEVGATVDSLQAREDLNPARYADFAQQWLQAGATIIGGCCEVGPAHIQELAQRFKG